MNTNNFQAPRSSSRERRAQDSARRLMVDADRSPFGWWKLAMSRGFEFSGRARRAEYWWFTFVNLGFLVVLLLPMVVFETRGGPGFVIPAIGIVLFGLCVVVPALAVAVRRLHDTGRSGAWILIGMIPIINYVGGIVLVVFYCMDGDSGSNEHGPSPKYLAYRRS